MFRLKIFNKCHNPFYYWWKARKYFKMPKPHVVKGRYFGYFGLPCRPDSYRKGPNFFCVGLGWKDKFDVPQHEWDPIICIVWINPWKTWVPNKFSKETNSKGEHGFYENSQYWFGWVFNWVKSKNWKDNSYTSSLATWEAILSNVIYNKDIKYCYNSNIWKSFNDSRIITIKDNLKDGVFDLYCSSDA